MTGLRLIATATAGCLLLGACTGGAGETTSTSSSSSSSTTPDYKDEAVDAARTWIEVDAGRSTTKNATATQAEKRREGDRALKKAGITTKGHDSVVSTEVDAGVTNTTRVVVDLCLSTDQELIQKGQNVRTNAKGKAVKPGDRQLQTVEMTREVGKEDWLVADVQVRERSC